MRTQLILTTAALGLAGAIGAQAQTVYSVNAVGYINVTVAAGKFGLHANQLNTGGNTIAEVLPTAKDGTIAYIWVPTANAGKGGYDGSDYVFGEWTKKDLVLKPGVGVFIFNGDAAAQTFTFVGEVPQGAALTTALGVGLTLTGSQVPQAGPIQGTLGYTPADDDIVYRFDAATQAYKDYSFSFGEWNQPNGQPSLDVAEGVFIYKTTAGNWVRNFTVN